MNWLCYGSSKSGIDNVTRSVALEQNSVRNGAAVISFYPGVMDTAMRRENQKSKPLRARIEEYLKGTFCSQPKACDPHRVAEALVRYMRSDSFGSRLYVNFNDIAPAQRPGKRCELPVDALRCIARAAIAGAAGIFRRSFAGGDGDGIQLSPARSMEATFRPRRKVLAMRSRYSRFFIQQVNPDRSAPSVPSCSSQLLIDPSRP